MFLRERRGLIPFHCSNSNSIRGREKKRREKETWAWDKDEDESLRNHGTKTCEKEEPVNFKNETEVIFSSLTLHSSLFFFYSLTFLQYRIQWTFLSHTSFNFLLPFSSLFYSCLFLICFTSLLLSVLHYSNIIGLQIPYYIWYNKKYGIIDTGL